MTLMTEVAGFDVQLKKRLASRAGHFELDVAFAAGSGITVIFGASGAGKTTVLECIAGLIRPDFERICLNGVDLTGLAVRERQIGYVFQELALFPHLTALENIGYGLRSKQKGQRDLSIAEIMESFHISHAKDRRPRSMSGGERQRVALARSLVTAPRALLLDEPMSALDYETKAGILRDLREWHSRHRIPVIYVTHSLDEVFAIADGVLQMANGKIIAEGTPAEILGAQRDALIQGLESAAQY